MFEGYTRRWTEELPHSLWKFKAYYMLFSKVPLSSPLCFVLTVFLHWIGRQNWRWICTGNKCYENHCTPCHIYINMYLAQDMVFQKNRAPDRSLLHSPCPFELSLWVIFGCSAIDSAKVAYLRVLTPPFLHSLPPHQITPWVWFCTTCKGIFTPLLGTSKTIWCNMSAFVYNILFMIGKLL